MSSFYICLGILVLVSPIWCDESASLPMAAGYVEGDTLNETTVPFGIRLFTVEVTTPTHKTNINLISPERETKSNRSPKREKNDNLSTVLSKIDDELATTSKQITTTETEQFSLKNVADIVDTTVTKNLINLNERPSTSDSVSQWPPVELPSSTSSLSTSFPLEHLSSVSSADPIKATVSFSSTNHATPPKAVSISESDTDIEADTEIATATSGDTTRTKDEPFAGFPPTTTAFQGKEAEANLKVGKEKFPVDDYHAATTQEAMINDIHIEKKLENGLYRIKLAEIITDEFNGGNTDVGQDDDMNNRPQSQSQSIGGKINIIDLYPSKLEDFGPIIRESNEKLIKDRQIFLNDDRNLFANSLNQIFDDETSGAPTLNNDIDLVENNQLLKSSENVDKLSDFSGKLQEQDGVITEIEKKFRIEDLKRSTVFPNTVNHKIEFIDRRVKKNDPFLYKFKLSSPDSPVGRIDFANTKFNTDTPTAAKNNDKYSKLMQSDKPEFSTTKFYNSKELYNEMLHKKFDAEKFQIMDNSFASPSQPSTVAKTSQSLLTTASNPDVSKSNNSINRNKDIQSVRTSEHSWDFSSAKMTSQNIKNNAAPDSQTTISEDEGNPYRLFMDKKIQQFSSSLSTPTKASHAVTDSTITLTTTTSSSSSSSEPSAQLLSSAESSRTTQALNKISIGKLQNLETTAKRTTTNQAADTMHRPIDSVWAKSNKTNMQGRKPKSRSRTATLTSLQNDSFHSRETSATTTAAEVISIQSNIPNYNVGTKAGKFNSQQAQQTQSNTEKNTEKVSSPGPDRATYPPTLITKSPSTTLPPPPSFSPHTASSSSSSDSLLLSPASPQDTASATISIHTFAPSASTMSSDDINLQNQRNRQRSASSSKASTVASPTIRKSFSRPRILTRLQEKINSLECEMASVPQDSHLWRGNETHELLLPINIPEDCTTNEECSPMVLSWEGQIEIQSGDVLLVEIDDDLLIPADFNQSRNTNSHKATTAVYQVTRPGHEHCDVTEGVLLDITPLVVDGKKLVTLYDKDLTEGINLLIVVSELWGSQCVRLKVTVKSDNCGENADCSGKGVCYSNISMEGYECQCCSGFAGSHCEEIDACTPSPCTNNGICVDLSQGHEGNSYQCLCPYGYTGKNCQYESDPCNPTECMNGGSCVGNSTHFRCDCAPGYTGPLCQHNLNECESAPCVHGICVDQEDGFRCFCQPGFAGELCNFEYNECESNPCLNNGQCIDQIGGYECKCTRGYTGKRCNIKVDFCSNGPCPEGHRCIDHGNDFTCECPGGRNGPDCNQIPRTLCNVNPCANGGTCWTSEESFYCACRPGYTGKMCEDEFVVETVVSSSEFMTDDTSARGGFNDKGFGATVSKAPIELHNAYIAAGTLAAAIFIVAIVVTICHCKVHQTYRRFSARQHQLIPIFGFGRRSKSPKLHRHWLSGKGGGGGGGSGGGGGGGVGGGVGGGGGSIVGSKLSKNHLPGSNGGGPCHNHHIGGTSSFHHHHQHPTQSYDRPFQRHLAMNLENDMYYTVDFSDSQHSPLIQ